MLCFSPTARLSRYASEELKKTWIRIGTANSAITSGWPMMASPWKANSSTSVTSNAPIDHGPIFSIAVSNTACLFLRRDRRHTCARMTRMTMYSATCVSVNIGSPLVSRLHTNTIAVHGAAASRISPAK
jgi:hypothetical protein